MNALRRGVDIVVACPGRLEDLIDQGHCTLADVEVTVLDEADHMADLGFLPAVRRLLARTPTRRPAAAVLGDPRPGGRRAGAPVPASTRSPTRPTRRSRRWAQMTHHVLHVEREHRLPILVDLTSAPGRTIVFTRTKHGAKALARQLNRRVSRRSSCTATSARTPAPATSRPSTTAGPRRSSRPTSPPAGSTSTTSPSSSTPTRRPSTRPTCTDPAAPPAPATPAPSSP